MIYCANFLIVDVIKTPASDNCDDIANLHYPWIRIQRNVDCNRLVFIPIDFGYRKEQRVDLAERNFGREN